MKLPENFENLTVREIFVQLLGEEVANELLMNINERLIHRKEDEDLREIFHEELCKLKISSIEVHELLSIIQITNKPQITPPPPRQITKK